MNISKHQESGNLLLNKRKRLPLIPKHILKAQKVHEPADHRFMSAARLLQSLWREERNLPIGSYRNLKGQKKRLGSRLGLDSGKKGMNFLTPEIAELVYKEYVYQEIGAFIDEERLWTNLLSSQPLCFNLFGMLKLDDGKANRFFRYLFPDYVESVEGIYFEHSPARGNPDYTDDFTAFDVLVECTTPKGKSGHIAIEVKYSESMTEPLAQLRPRYDELSRQSGLYRDADAKALRENPLQQLWREHMLSRVMVQNERYETGLFILLYPMQNHLCERAAQRYQKHLISDDPAESGFKTVILEDCIAAYQNMGELDMAHALYGRYLDFERVEDVIFS